MAAGAPETSSGQAAPPPVDPARAHLRDLIRQQVAARRPRPIARRTLELLTESALEPAPGLPAYRVVDRRGEPRLRDGAEGGPAQPLTLADVLAELEARHPALFEPPEPEPAREPAGAPGAAESAAAQAARLRDDAARYIELQSAKARVVTRAVAARSTARGRSVAASAGLAYASLRERAAGWTRRTVGPAEPPAAAPGPAQGTPAPVPSVPPGDRLRLRAGDVLARGRDALGRGSGLLDARWFLGAATAAAVVVAGVVLVGNGREGVRAPPAGETPADASAQTPPAPPQQGAARTPPPASPGQPSPAEPSADASPPPSGSPPPMPDGQPAAPPQTPEDEPDTPAPLPGEVSGPAEVVDTATLRVGGRVLHLFGVEWVRGGQPQDLARYLAGRPVNCQRAPGSENHLCTVEGRDLSEVVLFNGGGRASPEAGPDLVAAEDHARTERLGVWKR